MNRFASIVASFGFVLGITTVACTAPIESGAASGGVTVERVSAHELSALGVGETRTLDLTKVGVVYEVETANLAVDAKRVTIRAAGHADETLADYLAPSALPRANGGTASAVIRIAGRGSDITPMLDVAAGDVRIARMKNGGGSPGAGFTCNPAGCACVGDADCNDMYGSGACGGSGVCIDGGCWCPR